MSQEVCIHTLVFSIKKKAVTERMESEFKADTQSDRTRKLDKSARLHGSIAEISPYIREYIVTARQC